VNLDPSPAIGIRMSKAGLEFELATWDASRTNEEKCLNIIFKNTVVKIFLTMKQ
tara:strand:+ start:256 stop:417 length:162 start_codon:yes stop_codon:yes gene_type:complete